MNNIAKDKLDPFIIKSFQQLKTVSNITMLFEILTPQLQFIVNRLGDYSTSCYMILLSLSESDWKATELAGHRI